MGSEMSGSGSVIQPPVFFQSLAKLKFYYKPLHNLQSPERSFSMLREQVQSSYQRFHYKDFVVILCSIQLNSQYNLDFIGKTPHLFVYSTHYDANQFWIAACN